jgi:rhodanese-related sulfurtransferase
MKTLLTTLSAVILAVSASFAGNVPEISADDLKKAMEAKTVTIIDVNGTDSFRAGHIPGAIDFVAVKEELASKLPSDKSALVVAYCSSETCKAYMRATQAASELGYTNVKHYAPGLAGWKSAGENLAKVE